MSNKPVAGKSMDAIANLDVKNAALTAARPVKLLNAGLMERSGGEIVAHGWLDVESMKALLVGDYQREVLGTLRKKSSLLRFIEKGAHLPDIMIGVRGEDYDVKGQSMILKDKCFIIDGLQRIASLLRYAEAYPDNAASLRIGVEARFNSTNESEKELFLILNTSRIPVSPNVILRNLRSKHKATLTLYGLSHTEKKFALYQRVSWNQRMVRGELITALIVHRTANILHSATGTIHSDRAESLAMGLDEKAEVFGLSVFRQNMIEFFEVIDECFGIRNVEYREVSPQIKGNFLISVARMFATHEEFWKGHTLFVDSAMRKKLKSFNIYESTIMNLVGSGTRALPLLLNYLIDHMNKKKKKEFHLHKRT